MSAGAVLDRPIGSTRAAPSRRPARSLGLGSRLLPGAAVVRLVGDLEPRPLARVALHPERRADPRALAAPAHRPVRGRLHAGQEGDPGAEATPGPRLDAGTPEVVGGRLVGPPEGLDGRPEAPPEPRLAVEDRRV